jgi:hypothetical protein
VQAEEEVLQAEAGQTQGLRQEEASETQEAAAQELRVRTLAAISLAVVALAGAEDADAAGQPTIPAAWVADVTTTSAVLWAEVDPEGSTTRYHFDYLTEAAYEANLAAGGEGFEGARAVPSLNGLGIGAGSAAVSVSFALTAPNNTLTPATAYRFRAVAVNAAGTEVSTAHLLRTRGTGAPPGLPDGRAWELVSPVDKGGGAVAGPGQLFGGGDIQAAAGGGALTFGSATAFAGPVAAPPVSQYLSVRGAAGWSTENLSPPTESGGYGDLPDGAPFRVFSPDLGRGVMLNGNRCAVEGSCPPSYSLWSAGSLQALPTRAGLRLEGASPDLHHLVFGAEGGLYEWGGAELEQISAGPAVLAAPIGAVSEDGSRIYYVHLEDGPIELYEAGVGGRPVPETIGGAAEFQAASADGTIAYFTGGGGQLFRYSAATEASTPIVSGVVGVLAVSRDGSRVYYQDGDGLEAWHEGDVRQIAAGADAAPPSDYPPATATARLSSDGTVLAFLSAAPIGGFDNTDTETGLPDSEVYVYDAGAESLLCVSCNPTGERPAGSATIPGALVNGSAALYRPRALSTDGRRLFFTTTDAPVGGDTNSSADVYQWEAQGKGGCAEAPGCINPISAGRGEGGRFLDASADGADVFFLTGDSLVGVDPGSIDAYDARVGGGIAEAQSPIPCSGDACQPLPSPPEDPTAGSSVTAAPNPPPKYAKERRHHRHRHKHRRHRHRKGRQ